MFLFVCVLDDDSFIFLGVAVKTIFGMANILKTELVHYIVRICVDLPIYMKTE